MKKSTNKVIHTWQLAFTYAGCFLGAGYVSGQEIWQYFGVYGDQSMIGFLTAVLVLGVSSWIVLALSRKIKAATIEPLIIRKNIPWLRGIFGVLTALLLFGTGSIMIAGVSALLKQMLDLPEGIGALIVTFLVAGFLYYGLSGMVTMFSLSVPVLIGSAVIITLIRIQSCGSIEVRGGEVNPLLGGWFLSALNYAAVNYYGAVAIISPLSSRLKSQRSMIGGIVLGTVGLIGVAFGILFAMYSAPECLENDIPMYYVASLLGSFPAWWYALLLVLGMFGNAVSCLVGTLNYLEEKSSLCRKKRIPVLVTLCLLAYGSSLAGFGELISIIYPIFGYAGIVVMVLITVNFIQELFRKRFE